MVCMSIDKVFLVTLFFSLKTVETRTLFSAINPSNDIFFYSGNALLDIHAQSLSLCSNECLLNDRCVSFFFNVKTTRCLLHAISYLDLTAPETGPGWRHYITKDRIRCPPRDNFVYYRRLHLCYNINGPIGTDFNVFDSTCQSFEAELIRIDSEEKQRYIVQATSNLSIGHICMQGTNTIDLTNRWTFDDGTVMSYLNWNTNSQQTKSGRGNLGMNVHNGATWVALKRQVPEDCFFLCERR